MDILLKWSEPQVKVQPNNYFKLLKISILKILNKNDVKKSNFSIFQIHFKFYLIFVTF
jgi:hypothetical protein